MTLGKKIRKYRLLHDKTQKQLGEEVGFKKSTADVRINQYETDKMAPKANIRASIAETLDIDLEAISDINIKSFEDIMYVFFELEDICGMEIEKKDGKTYLSFDDSNKEISLLITYMNLWKNQKTALLSNPETASSEQKRKYDLWKSRFSRNIKEYFSHKVLEIDEHYKEFVDIASKTSSFATKTSEISLLLRQIIEAGFHVSTTYANVGNLHDGPGFTFVVNELLHPPTKEAEQLFAKFKSELNHFSELGADVYHNMQMLDKTLTITYFTSVASFSVIKDQVDMVLEHLSTKESETDFSRDTFEMLFEDSLKQYYNNIEDEIRLYSQTEKE